MKPGSVAVVGAAETELGALPHMSEGDLHVDAALRALDDAGLTLADVDGVTSAVHSPVDIAHQLGIRPNWFDGTSVGGCSFLVHVAHAAEAIAAGHAQTVLVLHGESRRSAVGRAPRGHTADSIFGQFEAPFGVYGPPTLFTLPFLRYMHETGTTAEQLAAVPARQSEWAHGNPRASRNSRFTVQDVLDSRMIAYPFHKLECCVVTDGGGALVVTSAERARDLRQQPVYLLGSGQAADSPLVSQMPDLTRAEAFERSSRAAFREAGIDRDDIDHLMLYDAFAHVPIYGLEALGFVGRGEAGAFIAEGNTSPGGSLPTNTNGGGLCYTHTGMYGMFAIQESVRQLRKQAYAQVSDVEVSVVQGVGHFFTEAATLVLSNRAA
ncbi:thiolase [Rhodococcus sp. IEGM 248]|uniref:thiolase C-terminal domain-containing protein n=1 Tax=Rhodococcus opacus TaxID=37919 RepID=UPI0013BF0F63|nr:thiolase [Rhodococcus opacus]MDV7088319.1 thiolase [Rhodococcus opacus]NDV10284.1 thiolase [Rhodococcus sp. IEGM 248]